MGKFVNAWSLVACIALIGIGLAAVAVTAGEHRVRTSAFPPSTGCREATKGEVGYGLTRLVSADCGQARLAESPAPITP